MDTEARKKRRKRNQYRKKLQNKSREYEQIVARQTLLILTEGDQRQTYEQSALQRQKSAVTRKIEKLQNILASLSPAYRGEQTGNTS